MHDISHPMSHSHRFKWPHCTVLPLHWLSVSADEEDEGWKLSTCYMKSPYLRYAWHSFARRAEVTFFKVLHCITFLCMALSRVLRVVEQRVANVSFFAHYRALNILSRWEMTFIKIFSFPSFPVMPREVAFLILSGLLQYYSSMS